MKTISAILLFILIASLNVVAQYPRVLSYTGVLADAVGRPMKGTRDVEFSLVDSMGAPHPGGWKHKKTFMLNGGMFSARLGDVDSGSNMPFPKLQGRYFLSITVSGDPLPVTLPSVALSASAYSLYSLEIADSTVSEQKILAGAVTTDKLRDLNVTEPKLADDAVSNRAILDNAVTESKLSNGAVTESKLGFGSVSAAIIQDGAVTQSKLEFASVSAGAIQDGAIQSNHLAQGSVTEFALADNSIANRHLQFGSVTSDKIQQRTIVGENISSGAVGSRELYDYIDLRRLTMKKDGETSAVTHAYLGDLYAASGPNQGQYNGYGFYLFGKDGATGNWNTSNAICGFDVDGRVFGTSKPFIVPDPTDSRRKIQYTAIEGPEAAMYVRGAGELINGKVTIALPPHFKAMAVDTGITVHLTPSSANSLGLAVTSVSPSSFTVQELQHGKGSYKFTYWVCAVRKGYEDYKVYVYPGDYGMAPAPPKDNPTEIKTNSTNLKK